MVRTPLALILIGAALAGCERAANEVSDSGAPTSVLSPWDEARARGIAFRAVGNEPGWLVEAGAGDAPTLRVVLDFGSTELEVARAAATPGGFSGKTADGTSVTLAIERVACSDSMSGQDFPASAVLRVGDSTYRGCGRFLAE